jgi:hypothetical protein
LYHIRPQVSEGIPLGRIASDKFASVTVEDRLVVGRVIVPASGDITKTRMGQVQSVDIDKPGSDSKCR